MDAMEVVAVIILIVAIVVPTYLLLKDKIGEDATSYIVIAIAINTNKIFTSLFPLKLILYTNIKSSSHINCNLCVFSIWHFVI